MAQVLLGLIHFGLRKRSLVVVVTACLLSCAAVQLRAKLLGVISKFSRVPVTGNTASLGLSRLAVKSLITVPREADVLKAIPWLQFIQLRQVAWSSTINMVVTPGSELMRAQWEMPSSAAMPQQAWAARR